MLDSQIRPLPQFGYSPGSNGMLRYEDVAAAYGRLIEGCRVYQRV